MCLVALKAASQISPFPELRVSRLSSSKSESFRSSSGKIVSDMVWGDEECGYLQLVTTFFPSILVRFGVLTAFIISRPSQNVKFRSQASMVRIYRKVVLSESKGKNYYITFIFLPSKKLTQFMSRPEHSLRSFFAINILHIGDANNPNTKLLLVKRD